MAEQVYPNKKRQIKKAIIRLFLKLAFAFFVCLVFMIGMYYIPQNLTYEYSLENPETEEYKKTNQSEDLETDLRTLRIYNGKIGVFNTQGTLLEILDIDTEILPEYDIALLSEGIVAQENEIKEICEGLIS